MLDSMGGHQVTLSDVRQSKFLRQDANHVLLAVVVFRSHWHTKDSDAASARVLLIFIGPECVLSDFVLQ